LTVMQRKVAAMFVNDPKLALTRTVLKQKKLDPSMRKVIPPVVYVGFGGVVPENFSPLKEEWTARLSLYSSLLDARPVTADQFFFRENRGWMSCKPMTVKKILSYLSGDWYSATRSNPPRLLDIGYARLTTAEKRPNGRRFSPTRSRVDRVFCEGSVVKTQNDLPPPMAGVEDPVVLNKMSRDCTASEQSWFVPDPNVTEMENIEVKHRRQMSWEKHLDEDVLLQDGQSAQAGPCRKQEPTRARQAHPLRGGKMPRKRSPP
jgi:hypothetical protein